MQKLNESIFLSFASPESFSSVYEKRKIPTVLATVHLKLDFTQNSKLLTISRPYPENVRNAAKIKR